jgi:TATA-box binding protein (TBP) (component of TFIID and TFIIIB)
MKEYFDAVDEGLSTIITTDPLIEGERRIANKRRKNKLPAFIPHWKCKSLSTKKQYPRISNCVVTVGLDVAFDLGRLSMEFINAGKSSKFPAIVCKIDNGTNLIFTTGAMVTVGCETYYCGKYLAHLTRLMIERVEQPILIMNKKNVTKTDTTRNLVKLTSFRDFRVVNIVSNGRLTPNCISLARMEADNAILDWNPDYFPGLEHILTNGDVDFVNSKRASMTIFDSGKGVGMGVKCTEDSYKAYQYVAEKANKYPDKQYVSGGAGDRFAYRKTQKKLHTANTHRKEFATPTTTTGHAPTVSTATAATTSLNKNKVGVSHHDAERKNPLEESHTERNGVTSVNAAGYEIILDQISKDFDQFLDAFDIL